MIGVLGAIKTIRRQTYGGKKVRLRHRKGMGDLAALLARPAQEIHGLDLIRGLRSDPRAGYDGG